MVYFGFSVDVFIKFMIIFLEIVINGVLGMCYIVLDVISVGEGIIWVIFDFGIDFNEVMV